MSLVIFPFKEEALDVIAANLETAATHARVREVWAVAAGEGTALTDVSSIGGEIAKATRCPVGVFPQERIGVFRSGKGDGMNTALALAAERGFDRVHFYDADITNFDASWIEGAESAADRGFGVVRHRFPRAATDAMITWMITRPALAMIFPGTILPRLGQPLGGEILLTSEAVESLASDEFVRQRSDWGIDTVITHATSRLGLDLYEHNAPDGKRHALYGALTDIRDMVLECVDAAASLRGRRPPDHLTRFETDPLSPVPEDLKETVGFDLTATRAAIAAPPSPGESEVLTSLGVDPGTDEAMDSTRWGEVLWQVLQHFDLTSEDWRSAVFRLWVQRVIHYTTHEVPRGYDSAIAYLDHTIATYERRDG